MSRGRPLLWSEALVIARLYRGGTSQAEIRARVGRDGNTINRVLTELGLLSANQQADTVACLICQRRYRQLHRHLGTHGLTASEYRERFGRDTPFKSAASRQEFKRGKVQRGRPGPRLDYTRIAQLRADGHSHRQIAEMVGSPRQSVSRVLNRLRRENVP